MIKLVFMPATCSYRNHLETRSSQFPHRKTPVMQLLKVSASFWLIGRHSKSESTQNQKVLEIRKFFKVTSKIVRIFLRLNIHSTKHRSFRLSGQKKIQMQKSPPAPPF